MYRTRSDVAPEYVQQHQDRRASTRGHPRPRWHVCPSVRPSSQDGCRHNPAPRRPLAWSARSSSPGRAWWFVRAFGRLSVPYTLRAMSSRNGPSVTVVIPTLNEERHLGECIASVAGGDAVQIIVSDGNSEDRTTDVTRAWPGVRVIQGARGRGPQMNRGAALAEAPNLLFLHADCRAPDGWRTALEEALAEPATALCCFRQHTEPCRGTRSGAVSRAWLRLLDLRSLGLALPYGDQGFGMRRALFDELGGFREIPLMEDLELASRCRRTGAIRRLHLEVRTSGRRFERFPLRSRLMTASFPLLFRMGVSPHRLARWYGVVR